MHVGIAYLRWRGKRSRHSRRMRTRNFAYLARGPWTPPVISISWPQYSQFHRICYFMGASFPLIVQRIQINHIVIFSKYALLHLIHVNAQTRSLKISISQLASRKYAITRHDSNSDQFWHHISDFGSVMAYLLICHHNILRRQTTHVPIRPSSLAIERHTSILSASSFSTTHLKIRCLGHSEWKLLVLPS